MLLSSRDNALFHHRLGSLERAVAESQVAVGHPGDNCPPRRDLKLHWWLNPKEARGNEV